MIRNIKKRNGSLVEFDPAKLNRWGEWAAGIGVEWGSIVLEAVRKCYDGCSTDDLHKALIATCVDRETTAHLKMAGRLFMGDVYKRAFGSWRDLPTVAEMAELMTQKGLWAKMDYTLEELELANTFIDHSLDLRATLTESKQIMDKYAIVDRVNQVVFESPQFVYMRMALGNMEKMPKDRRMEDVLNYYQMLSRKEINPPTPAFINLGTAKKQYASCCVFTTKDTAPSISAAHHIADMMTCASAGIGGHMMIRSKGDPVRGGAVVHQGKLPYYKVQEKVVGSNLQSSRGGANTMHFNVLDPEIDDLLKLKNVQQVADKRIKDIDYSVGYNAEFVRRVAKNENWMLISYHNAPDLHQAMYSGDQERFRTLYEFYDKYTTALPKQYVSARDIAVKALTAAIENRFYLHRTDEMNRHTPFKDTIYSSNLCQEIGLPTAGYEGVYELYEKELKEAHGEIGLCSLGAISATVSDYRYPKVAYYAALGIDNIIEIMEYPFPQLETTAKGRRSIGVGITNLAYQMAREGLKYTSMEGKRHIDYLAERHSYWLHKASLQLAKERGNAPWMDRTKYPGGWLPIDTANREIDKLIGKEVQYFDWETLRKEIIEQGGIRNSVLEAHMPCESSSVASGHTNGLYPIRQFKVVKTSGTNKNLFIAPDADTLKDRYEFAWEIPTKDLIEMYAIVQKYTGQAISADFYIAYDNAGERKLSTKQLLEEFVYMTKLGMKTRYYVNSATGGEMDGLKAQEEEEAACDTCSL